MNTHSKWANYSIVIIALCLLLYYGGNVVLPFIFSIFITILLLPLVNFLERIYFPKWLAAIIAVTLITGLLGGIGFFVYTEIDVMARGLPEIIKQNKGVFQQTGDWFASFEIADQLEQFSKEIVSNSAGYLQYILSYISSTLFMIVTIPVYVLFMLIYRSRVEAFINLKYQSNLAHAQLVGKKINKSVQNYIIGLFFVVLSVSVLLSTGLYFLDIPYWLLLGILCGLLTLLPYIGVVIGALLPLTIAFLTKDSLFYPISVMALFIIVQFLEGNVITPNIIGNAVNVNPVALMLGLLLMGALSGILGLILTIPILAVVRILFDSSEEFKPFAKLLANSDE